ncbi:WSC-domain-containing protein [Clavulina sp. PMI_390]|nr:WSC-domain-containing protein [Clavulina sp. PMI_390]
MTCGGDSTQLCGGSYAINIYSLTYKTVTVSGTSTPTTTSTSTSASSSPTWTSLGCFTDANTRALSGPNVIYSTTNTPQVCIAYCTSQGYSLAGVESGQECWCGNSVRYSGGAGQMSDTPATSCGTVCTGDKSQTCGGSWYLSIYASPAYVSSTKSSWTISDTWAGTSFFNGWTFDSFADPTHGIVDYQASGPAFSSGLAYVNSAGHAVMGIDTTPNLNSTTNRKSIRIQTNKQYNSGIFVIDAVHMPAVCGAWPAFWTVGPTNWPANGEIDIVEGIHTAIDNQMSIHTAPGCTMPTNGNQTGSLTGSNNCDAAATGDAGCGVMSTQTGNYGAPYNSAGGGVHISAFSQSTFAIIKLTTHTNLTVKWDSTGISIWFFQRGSIPSDISIGQPQPTTWGVPAANWPASTCTPSQFFQNHVIVFDTTLCGDWAGSSSAWTGTTNGQSQSCASATGYSTCAAYVRAQGAAFANAYWEVKSVKVYQ